MSSARWCPLAIARRPSSIRIGTPSTPSARSGRSAGTAKSSDKAAMPFLALDRLTKHFGAHVAVEDLSLAVEKGELVALLGPSGCGKTTTLQMIAGFVAPSSGAITLAGKDLLAVKPSQRGL